MWLWYRNRHREADGLDGVVFRGIEDPRLPKIPSKIAKFHLQIVENRLEFQSKSYLAEAGNLLAGGGEGEDRELVRLSNNDIAGILRRMQPRSQR